MTSLKDLEGAPAAPRSARAAPRRARAPAARGRGWCGGEGATPRARDGGGAGADARAPAAALFKVMITDLLEAEKAQKAEQAKAAGGEAAT